MLILVLMIVKFHNDTKNTRHYNKKNPKKITTAKKAILTHGRNQKTKNDISDSKATNKKNQNEKKKHKNNNNATKKIKIDNK